MTATPSVTLQYVVALAVQLSEIENLRVATGNRVAAYERDGLEGRPEHAAALSLRDSLAGLEAETTKTLEKAMKGHPLGPWQKQAKGVGAKQLGRLLGAIGDPYWNALHERPRTRGELLAYCGLTQGADGQARRRRKGERANWSTDAKTRAFLIATSCVKSGGPYREVYDKRRWIDQDAVHAVDCVRCGPAGKPAPAGSALSDGHKHARALRAISRTLLLDLWEESRRLHEAGVPL